MNESPAQERVFYKDTNVTVTQSRYLAGSKTYAMRNISSVSLYKIKKSRTMPIVLAAIGAMLLFGDGTVALGACLAVVGVVWFLVIKDGQ